MYTHTHRHLHVTGCQTVPMCWLERNTDQRMGRYDRGGNAVTQREEGEQDDRARERKEER